MKQNIKLIIPGDGLLTRLSSLFILRQTFLEVCLTFGIGKFHRCCDFLANGSIGSSLELVAALKQVLELMELITHPKPIFASGLVAGFKANASVRGHPKTVKVMSTESFKMRFPSLGRAI